MKQINIIYMLIIFSIFTSCEKNNNSKNHESSSTNNTSSFEITNSNINLSLATLSFCNLDDNYVLKRLDSDNINKIKTIFNNTLLKKSCIRKLTTDLHETFIENKKNIIFNPPKNIKTTSDYDIIIIGAGVHASIFSLNYKLKHPNAKILMIDGAKNIAEHFKSTDYLINSPENRPTAPKSTNVLPNSPLALADLGNPTDTFFLAHLLWQTIVLNSFAANSDILLDTQISQFEYNQTTKLFKVKIDTNAEIYANKLIIANGLGTPKFENFVDKNFREEQIQLAKNCLDKICLPQVITFDDLIKYNENWKNKYNDNVYNKLKTKQKIAVVGAGDAANVLIEFLYDAAPDKAYEDVNNQNLYQSISNLYWFAQKNKTSTAFLNDPNIKARYKVFKSAFYQDIFDNQATYHLNPENSHITAIDFNNATKKVILTDSNNVKYDVDQVILTSGYSNSVNYIISPILKKNIKETEVKDHFNDILNTNGRAIARKLKLDNGQTIELYVIGTAAGTTPAWSLANTADLNESITKNAASINVLAPKTAAFAESL